MRMRHIEDGSRPDAAEPPMAKTFTPQPPSIDPADSFGSAPPMRRGTDEYPVSREAPAPDPYRSEDARPHEPVAQRGELSSIRSSLLKKPLSSLLKS